MTPELKADPCFKDIQLGGYPVGDGMFGVVGFVASENVLNELKMLIAESKPPVKTKWSVEIWNSPPQEAGVPINVSQPAHVSRAAE